MRFAHALIGHVDLSFLSENPASNSDEKKDAGWQNPNHGPLLLAVLYLLLRKGRTV